MRGGDCSICRRRDRYALAKSKLAGEPTRSIARRKGIPEATLRRHFAGCQWNRDPVRESPAVRPVEAPREVPTVAPERAVSPAVEAASEIRFSDLKLAAERLGLPLARLAACVVEHVGCDVTTDEPAETDELLALIEAALAEEDYRAGVACSLG